MQPIDNIYADGLGYSNSLIVAVDQRNDLTDIDLVYKWVILIYSKIILRNKIYVIRKNKNNLHAYRTI